MNGIRIRAAALALVVVAAAATSHAQQTYTGPITDRSKICMMQDSLQPRQGLEYKHDGKSYWLCCSMCEAKFKESPDAYANAKDPVSGAKVDKATAPAVYAFQGHAFFFESDANMKKFAAAPAQYANGK